MSFNLEIDSSRNLLISEYKSLTTKFEFIMIFSLDICGFILVRICLKLHLIA